MGNEKGFTLIELFITVAIVGILTALSWVAFNTYKDDAEYARAQQTLRSALTALSLGELEAPDGFSVTSISDALSGEDGEAFTGNLAIMFPGFSAPANVQIGGIWVPCSSTTSTGLSKMVLSIPCSLESRIVMWTKLCNGVNYMLDDVSSYAGPSCQSS